MLIVYIVAALCLLAAVYLFMIFPSRRLSHSDKLFKSEKAALTAHRGLHGAEMPENSLGAFRLACEQGFGSELDVHICTDGKLVVFHDDNLFRMCGADKAVEECSSDYVTSLSLGNSSQHPPLFSEVLKLIDSRFPLIIEIKGVNTDMSVCEKTAEALDGYGGEYVIESFNPFYLAWFKKHRPGVIRGQLSSVMKSSKTLALRLRDFFLSNLLLNFLSRPDFVAYCHSDSGKLSFRLCSRLGAFPVAWTIRSAEELTKAKKHFRAFIFENFLPR